MDSLAGAVACLDDAAPIRSELYYRINMSWRSDDGKFLESQGIDFDLTFEAIKSVEVALDLVSVDTSIDHGDVDAAFCMGKPKLIDDDRIGLSLLLTQALVMKCCADQGIVGGAGHWLQCVVTTRILTDLAA